MKPLCLDLFAGAGGTSVGLTRAGFEVVHFEWDPDACSTLRAAFPDDEVVQGDLREVAWERWAGKVDLLWSSFPCQAFSMAGNRLGASDERNGWPWTVEAIDRAKPTWVLCENVPGLLTHKGGDGKCSGDPAECPRHYFDDVIMPQLRERFAWADYRQVDAADYGVPQHRNRVILAAGPEPLPWPEPTHCDPRNLLPIGLGKRKPWVTVRQALHLGPGRVIGGGGNPRSPGDERSYRDLTDEPGTTISAVVIGNAGPWIVVPVDQEGVVGDVSGVKALELLERNSGSRGATARSLDAPSPTVIAGPGGGFDRLSIREGVEDTSGGGSVLDLFGGGDDEGDGEILYRRGRDGGSADEAHGLDEPSCAVRGAAGGSTQPFLRMQGSTVRRLTTEECAALQSFPTDHPFQGSKTARYRQVGNAVAPPVAEALARAVRSRLGK